MSTNETLRRRLDFLKFDSEATRLLEAHASKIGSYLPSSLDAFYEQLRVFPEVRRFFSDERQIEGAKAAQARHWSAIAGGRFDSAYVDSVERIGKMHAKIGLEPRWYIGGYALILDNLLGQLLQGDARRSGMFGGRKAPAVESDLTKVAGLVIKAALLDMDIVITTYLESAEAARVAAESKAAAESEETRRRNDAERAAVAAEQTKVVDALSAGLAGLAAGDLTVSLTLDVEPHYQKLKDDFNEAIAKLREAMSAISGGAGGMRSGAGEISQAANDLSKRTEQQAATLEETAAALDQITATVKKSAESAIQANAVVTVARQDAEKSGEVVRDAVSAMGHIEQSSQQISQIIGVIDEIAFQTNLLALNAGVEAARAGDAGKGFAVVASEVRALAQRSAEAAKEIKSLISASSQQVGQGVSLVGQTGEALQRIVVKVAEISGLVSEITASAQEQSTALSEVNTAVNQMDQVTQQNAAMVEQSTAASHSLNQEADELVRLVGRFNTEPRGRPDRVEAPPALRAPPARPRVSRPDVAEFRNRYAAQAMKPVAQVQHQPEANDESWEEF